MLCIALVGVFALDLADAAMACNDAECTAECDMGPCDDHDDDGTGSAQHHCCHGTAASEPSLENSSVMTQVSLSAAPVAREQFVASGYLDALERPPKTSTAI